MCGDHAYYTTIFTGKTSYLLYIHKTFFVSLSPFSYSILSNGRCVCIVLVLITYLATYRRKTLTRQRLKVVIVMEFQGHCMNQEIFTPFFRRMMSVCKYASKDQTQTWLKNAKFKFAVDRTQRCSEQTKRKIINQYSRFTLSFFLPKFRKLYIWAIQKSQFRSNTIHMLLIPDAPNSNKKFVFSQF